MVKFKVLLLPVVCFLMLCYGAIAQEIENQPVQMPDDYSLSALFNLSKVITAGRREQIITEAPSTISVITAEDIKQSGAVQFSEVLKMIPGVNVGYSSTTNLTTGIRGFSKLPANKIVLLIDNVPWMIEHYGTPLSDFMPIALGEIKRVEVLRGPGSSLYGANAMFGVINIITKKPEEREGSLSTINAGEWNTLSANTMYGGSLTDSFDYNFSAGFETVDNPDYIAWQSDPMKKYWRANTNLSFYINDYSSVNLFGGLVTQQSSDALAESTGPIKIDGWDTYFAFFTYNIQEPAITIKAYFKDTDENSGWTLGEKNGVFPHGMRGIDFQHLWEPFEDNNLVWGANFVTQYVDSTALGGKKSNNTYGVFFDNTYEKHAFKFNAGLRYDHHSETGDSMSHRLALMYALHDKHNLRFTWGSSYRNPDFIELYYDRLAFRMGADPNAGIPLDIYLHINGQKDNDPEQASVYEMAYIGQLSSYLSLNAILFYTEVKNFVYFTALMDQYKIDPDIGIVIPMPFMNIGDADQYGAEAEIKYQFTDYLTGILNYTYIEQKEKEDVVKQLLVMTPQQIVNAQLRAKWKNNISANCSVHYKDSTKWREYTWASPEGDTLVGGKADSYWIINARIGYHFIMGDYEVEIALAGLNLLDKKFNDYPMDTSDIRRRITGFLSLGF